MCFNDAITIQQHHLNCTHETLSKAMLSGLTGRKRNMNTPGATICSALGTLETWSSGAVQTLLKMGGKNSPVIF